MKRLGNVKRLLMVLLSVLLVSGSATLESSAAASKITVSAQAEYKEAFRVLELVNKERAKAGVPKLVMDKSLLATAMQRAAENTVLFSHTRPNGETCFSANALMFGENIAKGQKNSGEVMQSWMNSSGHRANILRRNYVSIGIGCVTYKGVRYWAQCFGCAVKEKTSSSKWKDRTQTWKIETTKTSAGNGSASKGDKVTVGQPMINGLGAIGNKITIYIRSGCSADGYQLTYASDRKFTKNVKTLTFKGLAHEFTYTKRPAKCYMKVRAYKTNSYGARVYGKYSLTVSI